MERLWILLTALLFLSILVLMDIKFNYKSKLVDILGGIQYRVILWTLTFIIFYTLLFKFNISIFESRIGASALMVCTYLASVPRNKHQK